MPQPHVAHDRGDEGLLLESLLFEHAGSAQGHDRIAVNDLAVFIHHNQAIRVTI